MSNDLTKQVKMNNDREAALKSIEGMIGRVEGLKRKVRLNPCFRYSTSLLNSNYI